MVGDQRDHDHPQHPRPTRPTRIQDQRTVACDSEQAVSRRIIVEILGDTSAFQQGADIVDRWLTFWLWQRRRMGAA